MTAVEVPLDDASAALLLRPPEARAIFALAHGAGAGMRHAFLEDLSNALGAKSIATLRYDFPYMARKQRRIDKPDVLHAAVRSAARRAAAEGLPVFAGGKSMGGRMTTQAAAEAPLEGVRGIILLGFPLHGAGQEPNTRRAEHLKDVAAPMLFLQGTRDELCDLSLMRPVVESLAPRARMHVVEGADHSFHVLKRSGRTDAEVVDELAREIAGFVARY